MQINTKTWLALLWTMSLLGCAAPGNGSSGSNAGNSPAATAATPAIDAAAAAQSEQDRIAKERSDDVNIYSAEGNGLVYFPALDVYLNSLMQRIQQAGPQPEHYAKVYVLNDFSYKAFSRPAGNIYIDLNWLEKIATESELVALLAHEYGHICLGHMGGKNEMGTAVYAANLIVLVGNKQVGTQLSSSVSSGYSAWATMVMPQWGRAQELAADQFSYETSSRAGYSYTTGIKAFLESVKSFEPKAEPPTGNVVDLNAFREDHPSADDRLTVINAQYQAQPHPKHVKSPPDSWVKFKKTPEYRQKIGEYKMAKDLIAALDQHNNTVAMQLGTALEKQSPTHNSIAAISMAKYELRRGNADAFNSYVARAIQAPDVSFEAYRVQYRMLQDQGKIDEAYEVMMAGYSHFGEPPILLTELIRFDKDTMESLQAIPQQQLTLTQSLTSLKSGARMAKNLIQCRIYSIYADSCIDASLTVAQRLDRERKAKQKNDDQAKAINSKIEKKMNQLSPSH